MLQILPVEAWECRGVKAREYACSSLHLHAIPAVGMASGVFTSSSFDLVQA